MQCPVCQTDNPPSAVTCERCSTPFPLSEETLAPTAADHTEGWSAPITRSVPTETAAKGQLEPGTIIGDRYEILQLLGQGGMGAVYKARDIELERLVALKLIRPDLATHPEILQRFKQELILAREVTHRNVIRIFDLGQAHGVRFITMEYVEGRDLRVLLQEKRKLTPEEAVPIFVQIAAALEAAHHAGVVHRDLKPQNVMVDQAGRVYVMDFGVARSLETPGMTQTGVLMGTPEYMSPEQAKGLKLDARSDLFSLGIIFYETLSGISPFKADTVMASMFRRTKERAVPLVQLKKGIPAFLSDIVSKCLEIDTQQRYQSAQEIIEDLEKWKSGAVKSAMNPVARWLKYAPRQQKWLAAGIAACLVLAGGYAIRDKVPLHFSSKSAAAVQPISLAILPFHNASTDLSIDWLGPSLAEMLRTDIGQSASLRTISSERLAQVLKDLRIPQNAEFDPDALKRLAEFSSADMLVWGRYVKLGDQIRIDATLLDLKHERSIPMKAEAPGEKQVLQSVAQLAQSIQQNLALPSDVLKELRSKSSRPSSDSLDALRDYNEGLQLLRQGNNLEAAKRFEAAVQQDPQFALAYSRLALTYAGLGYNDKAEQFSRKASDLAERLPPQEKYLILANHARITKNNAKAIEAYENLTKATPGDLDVEFALAGLYEDTGDFDKARKLYSTVVKAEPKNAAALLALGRVEVHSGNFQGALDYLNQALSLTIALENDEERAMVLQAVGVDYQWLNKPNEALSYYQQSLDIERRLGQKQGIAVSLHDMASVEDSLGRSQNAVKHYQESLQLLREIGNTKEVGNTLIDFSIFYLNRGQNDQGLELIKQALQIERDAGDLKFVALCLNAAGSAYFSKGDYDNALIYFQQALEAREKLRVPSETADTLHNLAELSMAMGQYDEAARQYLRSLDLHRSADDKKGAALDSNSLGDLFGYQGRYGAALNAQQEALKTFQALQERSNLLDEILIGYGEAQAEAGLSQEGQKNLEDGMSLARELKSQSLVAQALNNIGDCFFYRGDLKSAEARYQEGLQAAVGSKEQKLVLLSKINLAKVAVWQGRSRQSVGALKSLVDQANKTGEKYLSVEASLELAQALIDLKDYPGARQELDRALPRSEKMGLRGLQAETHYLLGTLLRLSGKGADASAEYQSALKLLEQIRAEPGAEKALERYDLKMVYTESTRWSKNAAA